MLSESLGHEDASSLGEWKDVRQSFKEDPRFEAVKSGTRRQELYDQFTKTLKDKPANGGKEDKAKRAQASLAAREEAVKKQQQEAERHLNKSKAGADRQEAEREFKSLLIDAVRSSNVRHPFVIHGCADVDLTSRHDGERSNRHSPRILVSICQDLRMR